MVLKVRRSQEFDDATVIEIRKNYSPDKIIEMANHYQVSQDTIRKVAKGKTYAWVKDEAKAS
jgi:Mor family transcriptional regulator